MQKCTRMVLASIVIAAICHNVYAMRANDSDDDFFENKSSLVAILTTPATVALSALIDSADVCPEIKAPSIAALLLVGAFGTDINVPPAEQSLVATYAQTGVALAGVGYLLKRSGLPFEHKAFVGTLFLGISACRLWNAHEEKNK